MEKKRNKKSDISEDIISKEVEKSENRVAGNVRIISRYRIEVKRVTHESVESCQHTKAKVCLYQIHMRIFFQVYQQYFTSVDYHLNLSIKSEEKKKKKKTCHNQLCFLLRNTFYTSSVYNKPLKVDWQIKAHCVRATPTISRKEKKNTTQKICILTNIKIETENNYEN